MSQAIFEEKARADFLSMEKQLQRFILKHLEKLERMPPRRHTLGGNSYFCENVTEQARVVYQVAGDELRIMRCFSTHKEYERWYRGMQ